MAVTNTKMYSLFLGLTHFFLNNTHTKHIKLTQFREMTREFITTI